jgi:type IV pilus assembly protein PilC
MDKQKKSSSFIDLAWLNTLIFTVVVFIPFILNVVLMAPTMSKLYEDFGAQLPVITKLIIDISSLFARYWFILLPVLYIAGLGISALLGYAMRYLNKLVIVVIYFILVVSITGGMIGFLALAVYMPIYNLTLTM